MTVLGHDVSEWLPWLKGIGAAIGGVVTAALGIKRWQRETAEAAVVEEERKKKREIEVTMRVLDAPDVREKIVSVLIGSETVMARMQDGMQAMVIEEIANSPAMTALQKAVEKIDEGLGEIQHIFIQAGLRRVTVGMPEPPPAASADQLRIKK